MNPIEIQQATKNALLRAIFVGTLTSVTLVLVVMHPSKMPASVLAGLLGIALLPAIIASALAWRVKTISPHTNFVYALVLFLLIGNILLLSRLSSAFNSIYE